MALFDALLRGGRGMAVLAVVAGTLVGVATMGMIAIVTSAVADDPDPVSIALFAVAAGAVLVAGAVSSNALVRVTQRSVDRLRRTLVDDLVGMTLRRFEGYGSPRALALLTDDMAAVGQAVQAFPLLLINSVIVISAFAYIAWLSPAALGVLVVAALIGGIGYWWAGGRAAAHMRRARSHQDDMHESLEYITHGIKDLKLDAGARRTLVGERLRRQSGALAEDLIKGSTVTLVTGYWGQLLFLASVGVVVFAGGPLGAPPENRYALTLAVLYINTPLVTVLNILPVLSRASVALGRISEVGRATDEGDERTVATDGRGSTISSLALEDVTFRYDGADEAFGVGPVSHVFERGTLTFLVGGNGSGKSTLGKVAAGLYAPSSGRLRVDGRALDAAGTAEYRNAVSACFADSVVFPYPPPGADPERFDHWLREFGIDGLVDRVDGRLEFDGLSSGQHKRLALAQILADTRDVVLLDEWAAEQDPAFRERFYQQLLPMLRDQGRIVIVITHDDRFFPVADDVVKLERGVRTSPSGDPVPA